ncbi:MAG: putative glycoside hydrolase [Clostridia bacterium]|nr:putative glycoside hydrolase [Clostridia bacterium]
MGKNKKKNYSNHSNNSNNNDIKYNNELHKVIRDEENFDASLYKVEKENHRARMTDEELRDSIVNYKVPELDIPDFSHGKSLKKDDNSEKEDLLDKLLFSEDDSKKSRLKEKYDNKEIDLGERARRKAEFAAETGGVKTAKRPNQNNDNKEIDLAERARRKVEVAAETGGVKTAVRPNQNNDNKENDLAERARRKAEVAAETGGVKTATRPVQKNIPREEVVKKSGPKKKLNVRKLFKLIIEVVIAIIIVILLLKLIKGDFATSIKKSSNIPDGVTISDYTEAPLTNYGIYKTMPEKVRGVYISEYTIASSANVDKWIKICKESELNALVINVKNDDGLISFEVDYEDAHAIGADANRTIKDPAELTLKLKQNGIIPIARIVSFKDPYLAKNRSDLALKNASGNVLAVKSGSHYENWVNPYNKDLWKYVVEVSKCALDMGFKEIQYDYIRFGTGTEMSQAVFGFDSATKTKRDIIKEFSQYAKDEISAYGGYLAADVFGTIITSDYDAEIVGQNYFEMCKIYDYICPMIYPSHYNNGSLGITYPDLDPYHLVLESLNASKELINKIPEGEHRAIVRPWLQDFTATWVKPHQTYGPTQIREQKQAVYDSGNTQWLLWNAGNNYSLGGLD